MSYASTISDRLCGSSQDKSTAQANTSSGHKRKRTSAGDAETPIPANDSTRHERGLSNESINNDRTSRAFAKRACNECRQQKLRCDVVIEPTYQTCSRCRRLRLDCRIDANFRRIDKRNKTSEMERELLELRKRLAETNSQQSSTDLAAQSGSLPTDQAQALQSLHRGAADSLLELRHSSTAPIEPHVPLDPPRSKSLDKITVTREQIQALFHEYFQYYHPFVPVLDPTRSPDYYFECSELLFWAIITVGARRYEDDPTLLTGLAAPLSKLVWATVAEVPQNYHVVKALCLICTWPLPTKTSSRDPTFMLTGVMMHIALQTGLHRPSHVQEYSRIKIEPRDEDVKDRLKTWAACNVVAQATSTAYGQPPRSQWDFTLTSLPSPSNMPLDLWHRLQIERFCNKVSRLVYMNRSDPIGLSRDEERPSLISILSEDYRELETQTASRDSPIDMLHLQAIGLHLKLSAFFDPPQARTYKQDLQELYSAATTFLESALEFPTLRYVGSYLMQIILAAGFTLAKLLNSFFARHIDVNRARKLFNSTISAIRSISINNNDLPARLAEVLTQLWRSMGAGLRTTPADIDDSLQLKVRCRMSLSVVYDSVWRWREQFQFQGNGSTAIVLDTSNPTDPNVKEEAEAVSPQELSANMLSSNGFAPTYSHGPADFFNDPYGDMNYEVFDPLMSMLDSGLDYPYNDGTHDSLNGAGSFYS